MIHDALPISMYHENVKMEDFHRKSRLVAGGHMTDTPAAITHSSVVYCESVSLSLMLAALNALEVKCSDLMNAYITAPITDKVWTILRPEFGSDQGKKALIVWVLYMDLNPLELLSELIYVFA